MLYLVNERGETAIRLKLTNGDAFDAEDLASFKIGDKSFLLLSDAGDNFLVRRTSQLILLREPAEVKTLPPVDRTKETKTVATKSAPPKRSISKLTP